MAQPRMSEEAVRKATGHGWGHWFATVEAFGLDLDHTDRARHLHAAHPELSGWWCQSITVEFEVARGLRVEGESSAGGFQVNCSKTLPVDLDEAWHRLTTRPFLGATDWQEGAAWDAQCGRVEVRRADPGKMLRWFLHDDDGKSTVEVAFQDKGDRTAVIFHHHGLASQEAREAYRGRWKAALDQLA
jgi:hypothetical protein